MTRRFCAALQFLATPVVILLLTSLPVHGQRGAAGTRPRTPWGDPDLQGNYTNLWELLARDSSTYVMKATTG